MAAAATAAEPVNTKKAKLAGAGYLARVVIVDVLCRKCDGGPITRLKKIKIKEKYLSKERLAALRKTKPMTDLYILDPRGADAKNEDPTNILGILRNTLARTNPAPVDVRFAVVSSEEGDKNELWKTTLYDPKKANEPLLSDRDVVVFNPVFVF